MDKGPSSNIFDHAGEKNRPPQKKISPKQPAMEVKKDEKILWTNKQVEGLFDQILGLRSELDKRRDEFKDALALTQQDVSTYLNNPKNFSPEDWKIIQEGRGELEKRVFEIVGKDLRKVRQKQLDTKSTHARKGKTLGARRNWIPLR